MPSGDSVEHHGKPIGPRRTPLPRVPQALIVLLAGLGAACVVRFRLVLYSFLSESTRGLLGDCLKAILCGTSGLLFFFFLRAILRTIDILIQSVSKLGQPDQPSAKTVDQFLEEAGRLHISPRIAREAFQLFASLIPEHNSIDLNDHLRVALGLSDSQISSFLTSLPDLCGRSENPADIASIVSVYDLLHHLECAPLWKPEHSGQRDGWMAPPAVAAPASPLAGLQNASPHDSRFRTRTHFSGTKRRASDYSGPYRRATDRRPDEDYTGPRRRAADRTSTQDQATGSSELTSQAYDRRVLDRRLSGQQNDPSAQDQKNEARQHKAVDISLLNACMDQAASTTATDNDRPFVRTPVIHETTGALDPGVPRR